MESNSVFNHAIDEQNRTTLRQELDLSIISTSSDRTGCWEVLLPGNNNSDKI